MRLGGTVGVPKGALDAAPADAMLLTDLQEGHLADVQLAEHTELKTVR